ncbi:MAG: riboflavin synthase [Candidatus Zixiibacteriota bacterium]
MFTGLIQEIGTVTRIGRTSAGMAWSVHAPMVTAELKRGDSICIDGACQTVETVNDDILTGTAIPETLKKTSYADWRVGARVNLEPPLRPTDRLGGHFVSGHVDTVGVVSGVIQNGGAYELTVSHDARYALWTIDQGSIAINGVSLTIARRTGESITVALIPETLERTNLSALTRGDRVNLEFDQLIKAAVQAVGALPHERKAISEEYLANAGW